MNISVRIFITLFQLAIVSSYCAKKYTFYPGHTACLSKSSKLSKSGPNADDERLKIVAAHNKYRAMVTDASDMLKVTWDTELAMLARKWAENCDYKHEENIKRFVPGRFHVGQNLAASSTSMTWDEVVKLWHDEVKDFTYAGGNVNKLEKVGHYTQVVWASSYLIGCAYSLCGGQYIYVCDYGPGGNDRGLDKPYNKGTPGSKCSNKEPTTNLCDCGGKTCGGISELRPNCTCSCKQSYLKAPNCDLECSDVTDDTGYCGNGKSYTTQSCKHQIEASFYCPNMCKACPYAGKNYEESTARIFHPVLWLMLLCLLLHI